MTTAIKDGVFIHVSRGTDNPHRVLMALSLAAKMSVDKDVLVFFDLKGVEIPLKDSKAIALVPSSLLAFEEFETVQTLLSKLIDKGVHVCVCPMCFKAANYQPEDLIEGVQIDEKEAFFNFTQGRILSLGAISVS